MKNNRQQILSEIKSLMVAIKSQMDELENKIAEYEQSVDNQDSVEDALVQEEIVDVVEEEVMDIELDTSDDLPFYDDIPVSEPEPQAVDEPEIQAVEEPETQVVEEPESQLEIEVKSETRVAPVPVIDAMIAKQPWRTDMPGSPVKDVRSAISLNDRILFINYLFGEDPMAFQETLTQLNAMASFDEAEAHAIALHPEWNLESDTVYRFMMALRRRHQ